MPSNFLRPQHAKYWNLQYSAGEPQCSFSHVDVEEPQEDVHSILIGMLLNNLHEKIQGWYVLVICSTV
jgi:hypothetical protein